MLNDQGKKADDISDLSCKTSLVSQKEPVGCSLLHSRFFVSSRNAPPHNFSAAVCVEERCVTHKKTAV